MSDESSKPQGRRGFFRRAMAEMLQPLAEYFGAGDGGDSSEPVTRTMLRPPGAIEEAAFLDTCTQCGACVDACPVNAIQPLSDPTGVGSGLPVIDPDLAACVVCDGLHCTHACPSGALLPLSAPDQIEMGLARVYDALCVRTEGQACTMCVEKCPIGETALRFGEADQPPEVLAEGCVGCGVCQLVCPTLPKAIVAEPMDPDLSGHRGHSEPGSGD